MHQPPHRLVHLTHLEEGEEEGEEEESLFRSGRRSGGRSHDSNRCSFCAIFSVVFIDTAKNIGIFPIAQKILVFLAPPLKQQ